MCITLPTYKNKCLYTMGPVGCETNLIKNLDRLHIEGI